MVSNVRQFFAADDFSRQHFQMHFFLALEGLTCPNSVIQLGQLYDSIYYNGFLSWLDSVGSTLFSKEDKSMISKTRVMKL